MLKLLEDLAFDYSFSSVLGLVWVVAALVLVADECVRPPVDFVGPNPQTRHLMMMLMMVVPECRSSGSGR